MSKYSCRSTINSFVAHVACRHHPTDHLGGLQPADNRPRGGLYPVDIASILCAFHNLRSREQLFMRRPPQEDNAGHEVECGDHRKYPTPSSYKVASAAAASFVCLIHSGASLNNPSSGRDGNQPRGVGQGIDKRLQQSHVLRRRNIEFVSLVSTCHTKCGCTAFNLS